MGAQLPQASAKGGAPFAIKKSYTTPTLHLYGTIHALTHNGGVKGTVNDGPGMFAKTT